VFALTQWHGSVTIGHCAEAHRCLGGFSEQQEVT
jgi:hypothetical protein